MAEAKAYVEALAEAKNPHEAVKAFREQAKGPSGFMLFIAIVIAVAVTYVLMR